MAGHSQLDSDLDSGFQHNIRNQKHGADADRLFNHLSECRNPGTLHTIIVTVDAGMDSGAGYGDSYVGCLLYTSDYGGVGCAIPLQLMTHDMDLLQEDVYKRQVEVLNKAVIYSKPLMPKRTSTVLFAVGSAYYDRLLYSDAADMRQTFLFHKNTAIAARGEVSINTDLLTKLWENQKDGQSEIMVDRDQYLVTWLDVYKRQLGATINMDGTAIMQGVAVVFAAQAFGISLSAADYLSLIHI